VGTQSFFKQQIPSGSSDSLEDDSYFGCDFVRQLWQTNLNSSNKFSNSCTAIDIRLLDDSMPRKEDKTVKAVIFAAGQPFALAITEPYSSIYTKTISHMQGEYLVFAK